MEFVETTLIATHSFAEAQAERAGPVHGGAAARGFARGLFDPAGFARLVDVAACRKAGVYPLE